TKTLAMFVAAICAITVDPALRLMFTRPRAFQFKPVWLSRVASAIVGGRIQSEHKHPISRFLIRTYEPVVRWTLRNPLPVILGAVLAVGVTIPVALRLNSEFMPALNEGALFYMPSTMPGISITEAKRLVHVTDQVLRSFPEVQDVLGKAGRANSATDPAPLSMLESVITLRPQAEWRRVPTWYSRWSPEWLKPLLRHITSDTISQEQLLAEMNRALQVPGVTNAWTMPIRGRIDMLSTGVRTSLGLKIMGSDPREVGRIGEQVERALREIPSARSVFAERSGDGFFLDVTWDREKLARYGLTIDAAQNILSSAIGGENVTTVIDGRARYPVNVRYMRDFRSDREALGRMLVPVKDGRRQIPLSELATVRATRGPSMIRDDEGLITGYVYVDIAEGDIATFVSRAKQILAKQVTLPPGYSTRWTGQYEAMERSRQKLFFVLPLTIGLIFVLLWLNTRSFTKSMLVLLAVPFSAVGAFWLLAAMGYSVSVAVWIGLIALLGVDAETGVFMLLYLDLAYEKARRQGCLRTRSELHDAIVTGAARRIRPKVMTVATMLAGLLPVLWSTGTGADVMKRVAVPMVGGIVTSFLLELLVYPVVYEAWRWHGQISRGAIQADASHDKIPALLLHDHQ
ncbi:MAG: heavy metal efflux pump, CzcA family, partial [Bryobacterales bacterium]|nr:heavy metal efflux pump, CzcA family [Bryobacterales bacterium]